MGGRPRQRKKKPANAASSFQNDQVSPPPPPPPPRPNARASRQFNSTLTSQTDRRQNRAEHKRPLQSPRQAVTVDDVHAVPLKANSVHEVAHRRTNLKTDLVEYPAKGSQPFQVFHTSRQTSGARRTNQAQQQYQAEPPQQPDFPQDYQEQQSYQEQSSYQAQQQYQLRQTIKTQQPRETQQQYPVSKAEQEHQQYLSQQPYQAHQKFQSPQYNRAHQAYQVQLSTAAKQAYQVQQPAQATQPYSGQHSNQSKQTYQEHHAYQTQRTYQAQQLYETEEACEAEQIYEVEKAYHSQHTYHEQQSFHAQQQYPAQRIPEAQKVYHSRQAFDASPHSYKTGGVGSDGKNQEVSRCAIRFKKPHHHDAAPRLHSKASTDATCGGNENGSSCPDKKKTLPWDWWPGATNTKRYLDKHKNGEGLLFYRLAETPIELRKTKPDETDIWVHVGTVKPPVWGGRAPKDTRMWNHDDEPWEV